MRVKICGLQNYTDADLALTLGATEIGFIFTKSPRQMDPLDAKLICRNLPVGAQVMGVFKNNTVSEILSILDHVNLQGVQLHGSESPEYISELRKERPGLKIFKAIGVEKDHMGLNPDLYSDCDALLFDSLMSHFRPAERTPIDSQKLETLKISIPFYLAGGITPTNVRDLIKRYRPQGIDVSSGVEVSPGIKDHKLMNKLFSRLKEDV